MILASQLARRFGRIEAVRDATFSLEQGSVGGLLGVNGAGKSSTIRMLAGCISPHAGYASIAGIDICKNPLEAKRRVGYMPESMPLYENMSVLSYLKFMGRLRGVCGSRLRSAVDREIDRCSLEKVSSRLIAGLSRGFRQRVGIAQALLHDPEVLILDEPTSGLDPVQVCEFRKLIQQLMSQRTILLSTHILSEVAQLCDQVILMGAGRTLLQTKLSDLQGEHALEQLFLQGSGAAEGASYLTQERR